MPKPRDKQLRHTLEKLSDTTWRVLEVDDPYQQYCQMYVRLAPKAKRCFIIDTGCGLGNLRAYIEEHINTEKWAYTVICTHAHFDHVAGNHYFEDGEIYFGGADKEFCLASIGRPMPLYDGSTMGEVQGFKITKWLQDGELVPLDGSKAPDRAHSFEIHWNPGHSPDGISIYDPEEHRLYSGDFLYPAAAWDDPLSPPGGLYAMSKGSDISVYLNSLLKFQKWLDGLQQSTSACITLACGHNTYSMDTDFVPEAIELLQQVQASKLQGRKVSAFGHDLLEYCGRHERASIVLPMLEPAYE